MWRHNTFVKQSIRFGIVGLASNAMLYLLYLFCTTLGVGPKLAMTGAFAAGVVVTFAFNKRWVFAYHGFSKTSYIKYVGIYISSYLINLGSLSIFVDHQGMSHEKVQGIMVFLIAVIAFFLQKYWVFPRPRAFD